MSSRTSSGLWEEDQRTQSVLRAASWRGGSDPVELNIADTSGNSQAIGDMDRSSLSIGDCKIMIEMGSKEDKQRIRGRTTDNT